LELPLHIQDGALFYPQRLNLTKSEAWRRCWSLIEHVKKVGGVLTVLWHDRSPKPERFWGDFYIKLVQAIEDLDGWFGTANDVVDWFRQRREVVFERGEGTDGTSLTLVRYNGEGIRPPLNVRIYNARSNGATGSVDRDGKSAFDDLPWDGASRVVSWRGTGERPLDCRESQQSTVKQE
ncbi:MAG: hypothetical protein WCE52_12985, partial [Candidatus Acidiferrum sp.]